MISTNQPTKTISSVLLAEDNLEHCFYFKKALQQVNARVKFSAVHDGHGLMLLLEDYRPDLLFLDLDMPNKNGIECIKEIRDNKDYDALPIVVFTISTQANAIQSAYGFGANLYFVKPSELSLLAGSLEEILQMDWSDPEAITAQHFQDNLYLPFKVA